MGETDSTAPDTTPVTRDEFDKLADVVVGIGEHARQAVEAIRAGRDKPEEAKAGQDTPPAETPRVPQ